MRSSGHQPPTSLESWGYGVLCVTLISLMSVTGVFLLPLMSKSFYRKLLSALIGLAVGSLLASALFHLIPGAFRLDEIIPEKYLNIALAVFGGVYLFFIIERLLRFAMVIRERKAGDRKTTQKAIKASSGASGGGRGGGDFTAVCAAAESEEGGLVDTKSSTLPKTASANGCVAQTEIYDVAQVGLAVPKTGRGGDSHALHAHTHEFRDEEGKTTIATVAWMIIFGDGVHNFIDGLSIGAAFTESVIAGVSVSVAVLCEELPHELGDFAVLLNSGMTMKQAVCYNFLSACTCYVGLVIGILVGQTQAANEYIFAVAGGMFLYIALVDMAPEMNAATERETEKSLRDGVVVFVLHNVGILTGIALLYFLAYAGPDYLTEIVRDEA